MKSTIYCIKPLRLTFLKSSYSEKETNLIAIAAKQKTKYPNITFDGVWLKIKLDSIHGEIWYSFKHV